MASRNTTGVTEFDSTTICRCGLSNPSRWIETRYCPIGTAGNTVSPDWLVVVVWDQVEVVALIVTAAPGNARFCESRAVTRTVPKTCAYRIEGARPSSKKKKPLRGHMDIGLNLRPDRDSWLSGYGGRCRPDLSDLRSAPHSTSETRPNGELQSQRSRRARGGRDRDNQ